MRRVRQALRGALEAVELALDRVFTPAENPFYQLGALGILFLWVAFVSGVYLYIFFDTSIVNAYQSVEALTYGQRYAGGVIRSLHRYASDGLVLVMFVHLLREFALGRLRGMRWFSWITGLPVMVLIYVAGIGGYWLVWDKLAQYIAVATTEWLDALPIFGEPIARNFLSPSALSDRFFTLLVFLHIAAPVILLFALWLHLQRISRAKIWVSRRLSLGIGLMLVVLSLIKPAISQGGPANLAIEATDVGLDWFYLIAYPLLDLWRGSLLWAVGTTMFVLLAALPWLPPLRRPAPARVDLAHCNGCTRCFADCPFGAIQMAPRSDGSAFTQEAVVDEDICVSCGICVGACPSSTPFRRSEELKTGIDLPDYSLRDLRTRTQAAARKLSGRSRVLIFGCDHGLPVNRLEGTNVGAVSLPCIAMLPPSFIDYALSHGLADGVVISGCAEGNCYNRFGIQWMKARIARERDPYLRRRVPRDRLLQIYLSPLQRRQAARRIAEFAARLPGSREEDAA